MKRPPAITARIGPVEVDVPRTAGYYAGVGAAVAFGLIEWPVAAFIAGIPLIRMLRERDLPLPARFTVHVFDGAAKPVGGDSEGTLNMRRNPAPLRRVARAASRSRPAPRRRPRARPVRKPAVEGSTTTA